MSEEKRRCRIETCANKCITHTYTHNGIPRLGLSSVLRDLLRPVRLSHKILTMPVSNQVRNTSMGRLALLILYQSCLPLMLLDYFYYDIAVLIQTIFQTSVAHASSS